VLTAHANVLSTRFTKAHATTVFISPDLELKINQALVYVTVPSKSLP